VTAAPSLQFLWGAHLHQCRRFCILTKALSECWSTPRHETISQLICAPCSAFQTVLLIILGYPGDGTSGATPHLQKMTTAREGWLIRSTYNMGLRLDMLLATEWKDYLVYCCTCWSSEHFEYCTRARYVQLIDVNRFTYNNVFGKLWSEGLTAPCLLCLSACCVAVRND
jgi:hypothetical protein